MTTTASETFEFQAEMQQLLDIVVHSLYTEKDIFVRELISNASDALERLRQIQLTEREVYDPDVPLEIRVTTDDTAKTLTIEDTGVGMNRDELVQNLGTIAHSGSKAFLQSLGEPVALQQTLIGQFGVGFYSVFMVARNAEVHTRSWHADALGHLWTSDGSGVFTIAAHEGLRRGTKVVVHLKDDQAEFAQEWRIREILQRYSAFVSFPIIVNGTRINTVEALWLQRRSEVTDADYAEFYRFQAHAYDEPRLRLHFSADAPLSVHALLFVPHENTERAGLGRGEPCVSLYSRRVLIDARPKDLVPGWLRFLRGVVDSEDLPLNISRETMQDRSLLGKLRSLITARFLRFLDEEARQRPESYRDFYQEFGGFLKEGAALDLSQREPLAKLLRFESSTLPGGTLTSFAEYVSRIPPEQTAIYYIIGPTRAAIEQGPYVEGFTARGLEVLYCFEPVDEYVMHNVRVFGGKTLMAADHVDVTLPAAPPTDDQPRVDDAGDLVTWLRDTLDARVAEVRVSERLVDSPVLAVSTDRVMSPHMRRMMKAMNRPGADGPIRVTLEINPRHPVIKRLAEHRLTAPDRAALLALQLLDNALLTAGLLEDPTAMVARLNQLLQHV